jgi:hypothetical protein
MQHGSFLWKEFLLIHRNNFILLSGVFETQPKILFDVSNMNFSELRNHIYIMIFIKVIQAQEI